MDCGKPEKLRKLYKIYIEYDTSFNKIIYTPYNNTLTFLLRNHDKKHYKSL